MPLSNHVYFRELPRRRWLRQIPLPPVHDRPSCLTESVVLDDKFIGREEAAPVVKLTEHPARYPPIPRIAGIRIRCRSTDVPDLVAIAHLITGL